MESLNLLCWEGYESAEIVEPFERQAALKLNVKTLLSDAAAAETLVAGQFDEVDILNINNAYIRDFLYPRGLIEVLDKNAFAHYEHSIHPLYTDLLSWSYNSQNQLIGIGQRFGPFNLVINSRVISPDMAADQGFNLPNDPASHHRFGILNYPDFNVFHFSIGAGLNPFAKLDADQLDTFNKTAMRWYQSALMVEDDHHKLNQALINREIDFYISGGTYTASPARLAGQHEILAVTPWYGPIDGKGGIVFTEITSMLASTTRKTTAESFLQYMLSAQVAASIAFVGGTCNPVAQMGDPKVFALFNKVQLQAIQWEDLEHDLSKCAQYQIPPQNRQLLAILKQAKQKQGWHNTAKN